MAHFTNAQGVRISGQTLELQIGESKEIGLWAFAISKDGHSMWCR